MGAPIGPQRKKLSFNGTITNAYSIVLNVASAGFRAQKFVIQNLDTTNDVIISFDKGVTDDLVLRPSIAPGIVIDDLHFDQIQAKSSAGTPAVNAIAFA